MKGLRLLTICRRRFYFLFLLELADDDEYSEYERLMRYKGKNFSAGKLNMYNFKGCLLIP